MGSDQVRSLLKRRINGWETWRIALSFIAMMLGILVCWGLRELSVKAMSDLVVSAEPKERWFIGYVFYGFVVGGWALGAVFGVLLWERRLLGRVGFVAVVAFGAISMLKDYVRYGETIGRSPDAARRLSTSGLPVGSVVDGVMWWTMVGSFLLLALMLLRVFTRRRYPLWAPPDLTWASSIEAGSARLMSMNEAQRLFGEGLFPIGEAYRPDLDAPVGGFRGDDPRTWGPGGRAPLLYSDMMVKGGHGMAFAGSGGFKTTAWMIPGAICWDGPLMTFDPKGEIYKLTRRYRQARFNRRVVRLDHYDIKRDGSLKFRFDLLGWIDPLSPKFSDQINEVVSWIYGSRASVKRASGANEFFDKSADNLVLTILSAGFQPGDMDSLRVDGAMWGDSEAAFAPKDGEKDDVTDMRLVLDAKDRPKKPERKGRAIYSGLNQSGLMFRPKIDFVNRVLALPEDQLRAFLNDCQYSDALYAINYGQRFARMHHRVFSDVCQTALSQMKWLSDPYKLAMVTGDYDLFGAFGRGEVDIYLTISPEVIRENAGFGRVLFGSAMRAVMARGSGPRTLIMIDETASLGYMPTIVTVGDLGRGYGLHLWLIYQSRQQCLAQFGPEEGKTLIDNCGVVSFSSTMTNEDAQAVVAAVGKASIEVSSENRSGGSSGGAIMFAHNFSSQVGESTQVRGRSLVEVDEVRRLRPDEQILIIGSYPPIRCGKPIWFRRAEWVQALARFGAGAPPVKQPWWRFGSVA